VVVILQIGFNSAVPYHQKACWVWPSLWGWSCSSLFRARSESLHRVQYCLCNFSVNWSLKTDRHYTDVAIHIIINLKID